jgi:Bax inhibitor 1
VCVSLSLCLVFFFVCLSPALADLSSPSPSPSPSLPLPLSSPSPRLPPSHSDSSVQTHLKRVYGLLTATVGCAAVGVYAHIGYGIGGTLTTIITFLSLMYLLFERRPENYATRTGVALLFGFCKGASVGPLVAASLRIDPSLALTAFLGTTVAFLCFTLSAMTARRKSMLYLGGMLSSGIGILMLLGIMSMFTASPFMFNVYLYGGLMIFCGYVLYDTQMILERAIAGDRDYIVHAIDLFIDFAAIFVRILIILMKNADKDDKKKSRRR